MYKNPGLNPDWYNNWFWGCFNPGLIRTGKTICFGAIFCVPFELDMYVFCLSLLALVGKAWGRALDFRQGW